MYSYFADEDIGVTDWQGLKKYMARCKKVFPKWYDDTLKGMLNNKQKSITFSGWTDKKLISYWYAWDLIFLEGVAKYIEGRVEWDFESKDEAGYVEFEDGKCKITTGNMNWVEWVPADEISVKSLQHFSETTNEDVKNIMKFRMVENL